MAFRTAANPAVVALAGSSTIEKTGGTRARGVRTPYRLRVEPILIPTGLLEMATVVPHRLSGDGW
ncbi:hypothetical protein GCM10022225_30440 [Plantactinospora mayteni]|uniref:Uncharacterized protein n=1 Tax=Plantactinospora mayteni TaxID=566021 RepID=A0ABQ4EVK5_9ACTN|nr:hypothetical protein Pma05_52530 [Plantactinospora mayteni]